MTTTIKKTTSRKRKLDELSKALENNAKQDTVWKPTCKKLDQESAHLIMDLGTDSSDEEEAPLDPNITCPQWDDMSDMERKATLFLTDAKGRDLVLFKSGYSPLSNIYPKASFQIDGVRYHSVAQWTAAKKAMHCKDSEALNKILGSKAPSFARMQEAKLRVDKNWWKEAFKVTKQGIQEKFKQNPRLQRILIKTNSAIIGEANEHNTFWTTGVDISEKDSGNLDMWTGKNMMGKLLVNVRDELKKET